MVAAELRRGGTRVRRAEATKMDLDDEIFESFFACIGSVKEAKVCAIKMVFHISRTVKSSLRSLG